MVLLGGEDDAPIDAGFDAEDFGHFLWYIHVDPFEFEEFSDLEDSLFTCRRYVGIETVAHGYEVTHVGEWAMQRALAVLKIYNRAFAIDTHLLVRLYKLLTRWKHDSAVEKNLLKRASFIWCDALYTCSTVTSPTAGPPSALRSQVDEPTTFHDCDRYTVAILLASKVIQDHMIEGIALFYLLARGAAYIRQNEQRLCNEDRLSLLLGDRVYGGVPYSSHVDQYASQPIPPPFLAYGFGRPLGTIRRGEDPPVATAAPPASATETENKSTPKQKPVDVERQLGWRSEWRPRRHRKISTTSGFGPDIWAKFNTSPWSIDV